MNKKILILVIISIILMGVAIYFFNNQGYTNGGFGGTIGLYIDNPSTQEYILGQNNIKGNVDAQKYIAIDKSFAIGANKNGYAVFKNPGEAFEVLLNKYNLGILAVKKEFNLNELTNKEYATYKTYAWQLTNGTEDEKEQGRFITEFLDIYENSFN